MKAAQANRRVIAQRVTARVRANPASARSSTIPVSRNLLARAQSLTVHGTGPVRRARNVSYSGSGDKGYGSAWAQSQDFFTDPKWSATAYTNRAV